MTLEAFGRIEAGERWHQTCAFKGHSGSVLRKDPRPEERWCQEPHQEDRAVIQAGGEAAWTVGLAWMVGQGGKEGFLRPAFLVLRSVLCFSHTLTPLRKVSGLPHEPLHPRGQHGPWHTEHAKQIRVPRRLISARWVITKPGSICLIIPAV